jgi:hypothetical protein
MLSLTRKQWAVVGGAIAVLVALLLVVLVTTPAFVPGRTPPGEDRFGSASPESSQTGGRSTPARTARPGTISPPQPTGITSTPSPGSTNEPSSTSSATPTSTCIITVPTLLPSTSPICITLLAEREK